MGLSTSKLRESWKSFECDESQMVVIPFGPDKIRVAPPTAPVWDALAAVLQHFGYSIRTLDTDSYNCRNIKGTHEKSLHSFGVALDINWSTNPFRETPDKRKVRFSDKPTQDGRAEDVRTGHADTDLTPDMIAAALAIRTRNGKAALEWGGNWSSTKDTMHFEIDVAPEDLDGGIDAASVLGGDAAPPIDDSDGEGAGVPLVAAPAASAATAGDAFIVIARDGLKLRSGPSTEFPSARTLPLNTRVNVLSRENGWALVDLQGDGNADGFMHLAFLRSVSAAAPATPLALPPTFAGGDILGAVTVDAVARMFPATRRSAIAANLPFVLSGLRARGLTDRPMVLMALATIRAETEGFVPISEGVSRFNTVHTPFDRYDAGTSIGATLGNTHAGDGPRFCGRGYVQLTGRFNYNRISAQVGQDLVANPGLANDPAVAGLILAQFLKNSERAIRNALAAGALRQARKIVNGGSHGFDRFKDAYDRGLRSLPS